MVVLGKCVLAALLVALKHLLVKLFVRVPVQLASTALQRARLLYLLRALPAHRAAMKVAVVPLYVTRAQLENMECTLLWARRRRQLRVQIGRPVTLRLL